MLKKCFVLTQFGSPHSWSDEYLKNIGTLEKYGYYWKIFTPNKYENVPSNVEIVPLTIESFNELIEKKTGVNPKNEIINGIPKKAVSDFYVAGGLIFEDYLREFDFWGITNWDVVYGRLPLFIPDEVLAQCDIFSDDINTVNGVFSLFRNTKEVNNLFKKIKFWENKFTSPELFGTDEYDMTEVVRENAGEFRFFTPQYSPLHSHDRLEQHYPQVKLEFQEDGSLWECFKDMAPPNWVHRRPFLGREIPYFHFIRTKQWPQNLKTA